jgi:ribosome-associated heat shock protein Hsp15
MNDPASPRIDKWLWEVRLFRTRSLATDACKAGKVKIEGQNIKPSREVKLGEIIVVSLNPLFKTVKVRGFPKSRVSAKLLADFIEDMTPVEEYNRVLLIRETNMEFRESGAGRPTKKQRRLIDKLKGSKESW